MSPWKKPFAFFTRSSTSNPAPAAERARRLLLLNVAFAFYDAAMMWLLQLDVYPSWRFMPTADFGPAESAHFLAVLLSIFPIAVATTVVSVRLLVKRPTFVPARMATTGDSFKTRGKLAVVSPERTLGPANAGIYHALLLAHWLRVAIVTGYAAVAWWLSAQALVRPVRSRVAA